MIDWAQLAQSGEECQREAQIIRRNDGEILLMKYGHELCYIVLKQPILFSAPEQLKEGDDEIAYLF